MWQLELAGSRAYVGGCSYRSVNRYGSSRSHGGADIARFEKKLAGVVTP